MLFTHLNFIAANISKCLSAINEIKPYMSEKARLMFVNSFLASKLRYGVQFYVGERQSVKNKYHQMKMKLARWVKQSFCYKISVRKICRSINWETPQQEINKESVKFIQQSIESRRPRQLIDLLRMQRTRKAAKITMKY